MNHITRHNLRNTTSGRNSTSHRFIRISTTPLDTKPSINTNKEKTIVRKVSVKKNKRNRLIQKVFRHDICIPKKSGLPLVVGGLNQLTGDLVLPSSLQGACLCSTTSSNLARGQDQLKELANSSGRDSPRLRAAILSMAKQSAILLLVSEFSSLLESSSMGMDRSVLLRFILLFAPVVPVEFFLLQFSSLKTV
ncbi:hypothetical protein PGTUg99_001261 [Puccinia graminis f. sp. tritici]|uniref:Uncharacterized protein n=1 Tax=Puccinia graminis f. sp. tritici TaxID=56615 RepID=A0A5B0S8N7_PUCGR|nr:hypothetical protein PGTUg99_001261 [Puccinia graminis f. sp. tritici]